MKIATGRTGSEAVKVWYVGEKTINASYLIQLLSQLPPDAPVVAEGCDCIGSIVDIHVTEEGIALLRRPFTEEED